MSEQYDALRSKEGSFVEGLARELGIAANAKHIYGEPVERDGVTVVPVAKIGYGFCGGGGRKTEKGEGAGGGGGIKVIPIGYIEMRNGATRFLPTRDPLALVPAILAAAPSLLLMAWKITKLLKKKD